MNNVSHSEKSVASNVIVMSMVLVWLRSDECYLLFTKYSGYILQVRWIHL